MRTIAMKCPTLLATLKTVGAVALCAFGIGAHAATLTITGTGLTEVGGESVCTYSALTESGNGNFAVTCGAGSRSISISPVVSGSVCDSFTSITQSGLGNWTVLGCSSVGPSITLDAPALTGQTYPAGTAYTLKATATAPSGRTVASVQFFADGVLIHAGTLSSSQYVWAWTPSAGTYLVLARVTDSAGAVADTAPRQMTFQPAAPTTTIYYIHPDQLGTPRAITRASDNQVVWRWDNTEAFGNSPPNESPSGLGSFTYNLRFPGQYYDAETGTHYNYFRDYDPSIGRYVESDPIGRLGGLNTYGYVRATPLTSRDVFGLRDAPGDPEDKPLLHPDYRAPDPMQAKCWVICKFKMQAVCNFPLQALGTLAGMGIGFFAGAVGGPPGAAGGGTLGAELGNAGGFALCSYLTKKHCDVECPKDPPLQCVAR